MILLKDFLDRVKPSTRIGQVYVARIVSPHEEPKYKPYSTVSCEYTLGMIKSGADLGMHSFAADDIIFKTLTGTANYELELRACECKLRFIDIIGIIPVMDLYVVERLFAPLELAGQRCDQKGEIKDGTTETTTD